MWPDEVYVSLHSRNKNITDDTMESQIDRTGGMEQVFDAILKHTGWEEERMFLIDGEHDTYLWRCHMVFPSFSAMLRGRTLHVQAYRIG